MGWGGVKKLSIALWPAGGVLRQSNHQKNGDAVARAMPWIESNDG